MSATVFARPGLRTSGAIPVGARDRGIEALRVGLTVLVVFHHAAITYGAQGSWFYREATGDHPVSLVLLTLFCALNQAFFMGLFFLLAGYFTPAAIARHGLPAYVRDRLVRLGIPLLAFGLLLGPLTNALAGTVRGRPFAATLGRLWTERAFEPGPLWFNVALLLFSCLAAAGWGLLRHPATSPPRPFPSNAALLAAALATGVAAFALRLAWPVGTQLYSLQLGYFASYVVLFAAGLAGARARWWSRVPPARARLWLTVAALAFPALPLALLLPGLGLGGASPNGGWTAPAALYAFWEPLVAWGIILGLLSAAERYGSCLGPAWASLGRSAYGVFIIHPPVLVAVSLAFRSVATPPLLKFLLVGSLASLLCFGLVRLALAAPGLRRII